MDNPLRNARTSFAWAALIMVAFIIYGSLFPFDFHAPGEAGPLTALLATWKTRPDQFGNLIGNIFLYAPFGLFSMLALGDRLHGATRLLVVAAVGTALCVSMELIQFYIAVRVSTMADIYPNVLGSVFGAAAGLVMGPSFRWRPTPALVLQPVPLLLLAAFLAYRLFPYVPTLDLHQYGQTLKPVLLHPRLGGYDIAHYAVVWLVVAALGQALVGAARARFTLLFAVAFVLAAKVVILHNSVTAAEIVGAGAACVAWLVLSRLSSRTQSAMVAVALAVFVVAARLAPFEFLANPRAFGWIPFASFMQGSIALNTLSFLEKFFLYGSLIWLLARAGLRLGVAGSGLAIGLLVLAVIQTYLPDRSAEVTDAVMALVITGVFALIDTKRWAPGPADSNTTACLPLRERVTSHL